MYWGDFQAFVREHSLPDRTLKYYQSKQGFVDTFSICDFHLPRRKGVVSTGYASADWYRDSFVCNVTVHDGHVPVENAITVWDEATSKWVKKPARGIRGTIKQLVAQGVCKDNEETRRMEHSGDYSL